MAGTDLTNVKCYKCMRYIKHAFHRINDVWLCSACWYNLSWAQKDLIERDTNPYDWDLARKEKLISD